MEFLEKIGDGFNAFTAGAEKFITNLFGSSNEREISRIGFKRDKDGNDSIIPGSVLDRINQFEPDFEKLSEGELKQTSEKFRTRIADGETLDDILPEAFAAVREAGKRYLKMRHYDVQMVGGYILHQGKIAEMVTGEGKTLVASLPAYLNALTGNVHVITVNDYLALRDMEWMGPLHMGLGLTLGAIQANMTPQQRQTAYACDITYGTNNEFGFDYLRDNMKPTKELQVQGELNFALVDEIDNILIDEARTPLIISGPAHDDITKYSKANRVAMQLKRDEHFEVKEKEHTCHMTEEGVRYAENLAGVDSFYTAGNMEWPHLIDNSLRAHHLYKRDVNYVVENGQVVIVDEFTGRKMEGRQWSDGLHQAVEAKEGVQIKAENQTLATITLQNYFLLYNKLAGMTGTAMTEAGEFWKVYKLDVVAVPTNRPLQRINHPDAIYLSEKDKWNAVVNEAREVHETGRPILVGTVSIEQSELVSSKLNKYGIKHNVLNAKFHEKEAEIIAQAGRKNAVTIATNMAGRGTDIILGGNPEHMAWEELKLKGFESRLDVPKHEWEELTRQVAEREGMKKDGEEVAKVGGLHVVGTERHNSRRIDLQLRGRAGRQGDPGSSRFIVSLEDELMRKFAGDFVRNMLSRLGMQEGEAIESKMVTRRIEGAQKKVEEMHFDQRKNLLEYDEVMDEQRKQVYSYRQRLLDGCSSREIILDMIDHQVDRWTRELLSSEYRWETVVQWAAQALRLDVQAENIRNMDRQQLESYLRDEATRQAEDHIIEQMEVNLPEDAENTNEWNWLAMSKWANAQFGLNTNDRELKKTGREELLPYLRQRSQDMIDRYDFSALDDILADDFGRRMLCGWLNQQFTLTCRPEEFEVETPDEAIEIIRGKVLELYHEKEIQFPVAVGMQNFLSEGHQGVGEKHDREGLIRWANDRFQSSLSIDDFKNKERKDIEALLTDCSRRYFGSDDPQTEQLEAGVNDFLNRAYAENGRPSEDGQPTHAEVLEEMAHWADEEYHLEIDASELKTLLRDDARETVFAEFDKRYRPELRQAERSLILEVLDSAWKEHLYYMDHLRSTIGLVGYAQKDAKTEYKREGRKAFNSVWERIDQQVTSAIFRLEKESPNFVGSLWEITSTVHEEVSSGQYGDGGSGAVDEYGAEGQLEPGQTATAVEPIRNRMEKVGRNDPCPCGSGKKYKKCCGA